MTQQLLNLAGLLLTAALCAASVAPPVTLTVFSIDASEEPQVVAP